MFFRILFLISAVFGDIYLHNPRGSNNRCDERTNDRTNANRLFDSQNNGAGGYAVPCQDTDLMCFPMNFYTESYLDLRFTTQHACGIQNQCEIVIQYGCNMRDGAPSNAAGNTCTGTMPDNNLTLDHPRYGYHETYESYQACKARPRNGNLYTGDQVLRGLSAIYTRQNPNGQRYGFECPEERDYYPYWGPPSVWQDIAVMTSDSSRCPPNVSCLPINHTMVNRLGATYTGTSESSFLWRLPVDPAENCVLRIRYNISLPTDLNWYADKGNNTAFTTDPLINVNGRYVRLALDTAQLPRTFEDRSYVFNILQRPVEPSVPIYNINVQGKRGNIAQVRNCFEYDFVPNNLTITADLDYLHFQWVGSDFNPLGNDGEGRAGTDRSNIVEIQDFTGFNRILQGVFLPPDLMDQFLYLNQNETHCFTPEQLKRANTQDVRHCALLNNASVYFNSRLFVIKVNGTYYYMSTRNNNFSNRNQKGVLIVNPKPKPKPETHPSPSPSPTTTHPSTSEFLMSESSSATGSTLSAGYIVLIIACLLIVICSVIYVKRNYNFFKKKKNEITRSFAAKV